MTNKKRLIDANELAAKVSKYADAGIKFLVLNEIEHTATVDAWIPPFKPGDTVFFIMCRTDGNHEIKKGFALRVEYSCSTKPLITIRYNDATLDSTKHYLGLKAFMTHKEAEVALAKMDGGNEDGNL